MLTIVRSENYRKLNNEMSIDKPTFIAIPSLIYSHSFKYNFRPLSFLIELDIYLVYNHSHTFRK